jgi:hypothetical protein
MTANQTRPDVASSSAANREEPLLSGGGRAFLDGKIDADEYFEAARRNAAALAQREVNSDSRRLRTSRWRFTEVILFSAAGAYALLGALSLGTESPTVGTTAFVTGVLFGLAGFALSVGLRRTAKDTQSLLEKALKDHVREKFRNDRI